MTSGHAPWAQVIPMWVQVPRGVPAERSGTLSRPCGGACSRRTRRARAGWCSTRPRGGRDRWWSACASATGGGCHGRSSVARDVLVTRPPLGLRSLEPRSSTSGPVCRVWACLAWRLGSPTKRPLTRLWPSSRRPSSPLSPRLRTTTWPGDIPASRRGVTVFRPALVPLALASRPARRVRRASSRSPRGSVTAITAPP